MYPPDPLVEALDQMLESMKKFRANIIEPIDKIINELYETIQMFER